MKGDDKNKKDTEDLWGASGFEDPNKDAAVDPAHIWTDNQNDTEQQQFTSDPSFDYKEPQGDGDFTNDDEDDVDDESDPSGQSSPKKPKLAGGEERIKIKISPEVGCGIAAAVSFVEGGIAGFLVGGMHAVVDGYSQGFAGQAGFGRYVFGAGVGSAISFGGWLGSYKGTKCYMKAVRGKDDTLNSFGGGFVAGLVGSLRTRNPRVMAVSGVASGVLMSVLDFASHGSKN